MFWLGETDTMPSRLPHSTGQLSRVKAFSFFVWDNREDMVGRKSLKSDITVKLHVGCQSSPLDKNQYIKMVSYLQCSLLSFPVLDMKRGIHFLN